MPVPYFSFSDLWSWKGLVSKGLMSLALRQMDIMNIVSFGQHKYVHVMVDIYSHLMAIPILNSQSQAIVEIAHKIKLKDTKGWIHKKSFPDPGPSDSLGALSLRKRLVCVNVSASSLGWQLLFLFYHYNNYCHQYQNIYWCARQLIETYEVTT